MTFSGPLSVGDFTASGTSLLIDAGADLSKAVSGRIKTREHIYPCFSDLEYVQSWKKVIPRCEELQNHFVMTYSLDTCILVTLGDIQHLQLWRLHLLFWLIIVMDSAFLSYVVKWKTVVFFVSVSSSVFRVLMKFGTAEDGYLNYWKA